MMKKITLTVLVDDNTPVGTPREVSKALDPAVSRLWRGDTVREGDTPLAYTWSVEDVPDYQKVS